MTQASFHTPVIGTAPYEADGDGFDEALGGGDTPRPHYRKLMALLGELDLEDLSAGTLRELDRDGVWFGPKSGGAPFVVDPIPRILTAVEWEDLEAGLTQRVRALNAFVADVYGPQSIVGAGVVPREAIESTDHYQTAMRGMSVPGGVFVGVAGLDLVRDANGEFLVLEDNLRTPSGLAYACAARSAVRACLASDTRTGVLPLEGGFDLLGATLRSAAPDGDADPAIAILSDGEANSAWWEHQQIARRLGLPLVTEGDLEVNAGRLYRRDRGRRDPIDVLYRRCDEDRLLDEEGRLTSVGAAVLGPCRRGTLACVNAFGTGVADDKLMHSYVEGMVRFYLREEPLIRSVPTYDLGRPDILRAAVERIAELVIKPRTGHGGHGVFIGPHATSEDRAMMAAQIQSRPYAFVAQEMVILSNHPTVIEGSLQPRHVDLRPFVFWAGDRISVLPGGLTRVAMEAGDAVVNSSQHGGGKDTWVLADDVGT
jgi:carboxylate-amine ligase